MLYLLLVFVFVLWVLHIHATYGRKGRLLQLIPGPPELPFLGNMYHFGGPVEKMWGKYLVFDRVYGPTWRAQMSFLYSAVMINHPDDLEILLTSNKQIDKARPYKLLHPWLKSGLLTSTGTKWRTRRKILTSAFHFSILKKYAEINEKEAERSVEKLKSMGQEFDLSVVPFSSEFTLNVIAESAMGIDINELHTEESRSYKQAILDMGLSVVYRSAKPYIVDALFHPMINQVARMQVKALKILLNFSNKIIKGRKEYHASSDNQLLKVFENMDEKDSIDDVFIGRKVKLSILDLLLSVQLKGKIDEEGIREEVDTFTFEGHDTTGMGIAFLLLALAENKEHQVVGASHSHKSNHETQNHERARHEVNEVFSNCNGKLSIADLQKLDHLDRCIKESLRLFPPVHLIGRSLTEDLQLTQFVVPAGTDIYTSIFSVHRKADFWPEPEKFDPDRFLPDRIRHRHPFSYLPFSAGPRNCIGQKFAMNELKSITARILHNFYLEPITKMEELSYTINLTIKPTQPIYVKFKQIKK